MPGSSCPAFAEAGLQSRKDGAVRHRALCTLGQVGLPLVGARGPAGATAPGHGATRRGGAGLDIFGHAALTVPPSGQGEEGRGPIGAPVMGVSANCGQPIPSG
ncbi:unnamed protein product [Prorocentrum cordatum]|uniref:Uncharacterized protein n=1 Tax=Prorocentrum cordatum TaxID=2364126 RepID=A0ABN9SY65_9DINO|nr:unnamed protein product [Polarella glacialis]